MAPKIYCAWCRDLFDPPHLRGRLTCSEKCATALAQAFDGRRCRARRPLAERFWEFVPERPSDPAACWPWVGARDRQGYGRLSTGGKDGKTVRAHRLAFELHHGRPPGAYLIHRCGNYWCVRPGHLVTRSRRRTGQKKGDAHPLRKLTDAQVREMRLLAVLGADQGKLATRYEVSEFTVRDVVAMRKRVEAGTDPRHAAIMAGASLARP
jgi:hypothetical protein